MQSLKSKILFFLIRNNHLLKGKLKKEVFTTKSSIKKFREECENGASQMRIASEITIEKESIGNIKLEWLIPQNAPQNKIMFYVHGGGYVSGSCSDHRAIVSKFAKSAGLKTCLFEYRLAPEFPYPAALHDTMHIYKKIVAKGYEPHNILFAGESAGGGLMLATLLALKDKNIAMPKAAVAISPWTDLSCSGNSYKTKNKVSVAPLNCWHVFSAHYIGNENPLNPYISPIFGDLKGLPPLFINSAEDDELFDDGKLFYEKALKQNVDIIFKTGKNMIHCYPLLAPMFKEATQAMHEICTFIKRQMQ